MTHSSRSTTGRGDVHVMTAWGLLVCAPQSFEAAAEPGCTLTSSSGTISRVPAARHFIVAYPSTQPKKSAWDFGQGPRCGYRREVVQDNSRTWCVNQSRVHVEGHSSGALVAARLACDAPAVFASVHGIVDPISYFLCAVQHPPRTTHHLAWSAPPRQQATATRPNVRHHSHPIRGHPDLRTSRCSLHLGSALRRSELAISATQNSSQPEDTFV